MHPAGRCAALSPRKVIPSLYCADSGSSTLDGADALYQRIVFPLYKGEHVINLYGRSISSAFAHRFLPGGKGSLYAWEKVRNCSEVILVEGLVRLCCPAAGGLPQRDLLAGYTP